MQGFAVALPCSSFQWSCSLWDEHQVSLCKMLWCLKKCGLKVIFRKFFIHRHLPSVTGMGNVISSFAFKTTLIQNYPPSCLLLLISFLSTSCLPDLVLWKEKIISWPFFLCSSAASFLSNPFYPLYVQTWWAGTASPPSLPFALFKTMLLSSVAGWSLAFTGLLGV